jgi:hypothetical protein
MTDTALTNAYYGDDDGKCYWCNAKATNEWFGLALCDEHYGEELAEDGIFHAPL